jgi:hypothetical protein
MASGCVRGRGMLSVAQAWASTHVTDGRHAGEGYVFYNHI